MTKWPHDKSTQITYLSTQWIVQLRMKSKKKTRSGSQTPTVAKSYAISESGK